MPTSPYGVSLPGSATMALALALALALAGPEPGLHVPCGGGKRRPGASGGATRADPARLARRVRLLVADDDPESE